MIYHTFTNSDELKTKFINKPEMSFFTWLLDNTANDHLLDITQSAEFSYVYSLLNCRTRFELGEHTISKSARYSYRYAYDILKDRFYLGEDAISKSAEWAYQYKLAFIKGRWPEAEETLMNSLYYQSRYIRSCEQ